MGAAAELYGISVADDAYHVSVLFSKQGHGAHCLCLIHGGVTLFDEREVGADELVHAGFNGAEFLIRHLLEMGEVKAEVVRAHE